MNNEQKKAPKPFLKKNSRQFLSNAQVRSQPQKKFIVEFEGSEQSVSNLATFGNFGKGSVKEDIKITIKKTERRESVEFPRTKQIEQEKQAGNRAKENKQSNEEVLVHTNLTSASKRKQALEDYIGGAKKMDYGNQKSKEKPGSQVTTMAQNLRRQQNLQNSNDEDESANEFNQQAYPRKVSMQINKTQNQQQEEALEQVNFNSDSEEEGSSLKTKNRLVGNGGKGMRIHEQEWGNNGERDEKKQQTQPQPVKSKVLQKYYKKEVEPVASMQSVPGKNVPNKLSLQDIPLQLRQLIFEEAIAGRKEELNKKLEELKTQIVNTKKTREKFEEDQKQLAKDREQFQKQMDERNKEFQEKVKAETGKLAREKKYMKNQQTTGREDWRVKNQVQQLKAALEEAQTEKKKIEVKLKGEIDRLKKRLQEQMENSKNLAAQIKTLEINRVREQTKDAPREHLKDTKVGQSRGTWATETKVSEVKTAQVRKSIKSIWSDAPMKSYVSKMLDDDFTLISLESIRFSYESIEYYQYYLTKKDEVSELVSEQAEGNKLTRVYRNGKEEQEYIGKTLKEVFPFKFTIVQHSNEDIKMSLPEGIQVYYDSRSQITEFIVTPTKTILYFHKIQQAELKFRMGQAAAVYESYKDGVLLRRTAAGEVLLRCSANGQLSRL